MDEMKYAWQIIKFIPDLFNTTCEFEINNISVQDIGDHDFPQLPFS